SSGAWPDWLAEVIDRESTAPDRRQWWFWRVHDPMAILDLWSRRLPPENIHVIITPPRGSAQGELWQRFAAVLGIDPHGADLSRARPNTSLGPAETEVLRRPDQGLPGQAPDQFCMWNVNEAGAHQARAARERHGRLVLPAEREPWAKEQAEALADALSGSGYQVIGDLAELRPSPPANWSLQPANQPAERVLDAAVHG